MTVSTEPCARRMADRAGPWDGRGTIMVCGPYSPNGSRSRVQSGISTARQQALLAAAACDSTLLRNNDRWCEIEHDWILTLGANADAPKARSTGASRRRLGRHQQRSGGVTKCTDTRPSAAAISPTSRRPGRLWHALRSAKRGKASLLAILRCRLDRLWRSPFVRTELTRHR